MADARAGVAKYNRALLERIRERDKQLVRAPVKRVKRWTDLPFSAQLTNDDKKG